MAVKRFNYGAVARDPEKPSGASFARVAAVVCVFVMLREFRPVEPFLTSYLTSPPLNLTSDEVNEEVYPVGTYSCWTFAIFMFLITDYLRYKPIILWDGITGIVTYVLLLGQPSMTRLTVEQIFFGFFYSSDIAANTYLYAKFDDLDQYQKITGYVRASSLVGRFISGIFGQVVVSFGLMEKSGLVVACTAGMAFVTLWSFLIPPVDHSIYFHRVEKQTVDENDPKSKVVSKVKSEKFSVVCQFLWKDFKVAYTNPYILKWSLWWAFSLGGSYFVSTYSQVLWQTIIDDSNGSQSLMNGAIESISTITSAGSAFLISRTGFQWRRYGNWILVVVTALLSMLLLYSYECTALWNVYGAYIVFSAMFQTMLTIAQSEVAQNLERDSYALIFGFNNFVALTVGSLCTYTVIEGRLIHFTTRQQFLFYGTYYAVVASVVLIKAIKDLLCSRQVVYALLRMVSDFTKIAVIVCVFVLAREFRPIEPFLTAYLTQPPLNLTTEEVNERVYPTGTYASLTWVVIVFVVTDYLRYKPIIILDGLAGVMTYALLLGKPSLSLIKIEQIFYGFFYASDVASTTYLYAKIQDPSLYQKMTGYVRTSSLIGRFANGIFSQSMVSLNILRLNELMYASIAGMMFVTAWAFMIPSVNHSIYFHRREDDKDTVSGDGIDETTPSAANYDTAAVIKKQKLRDVGARLWDDFKTAYRNCYVLKWSAWWTLNLTVCYFMETYIQVLWQTIAIETDKVQYLWNGAVESMSTLLSAAGVHLICRTRMDWISYGDWIVATATAALSLFLSYLYTSDNLWLAYFAYIAYEIVFHSIFTIAQAEVAKNLRQDSFVLVFGFNNFVALSLSSILTYVMIEGNLEFLNFTTRQQFLFFGGYLCLITMVTVCRAAIGLYRSIVVKPTTKCESTV